MTVTSLPLSGTHFDCPRTCPLFERRDLCRVNPVFKAIGPVVVNSHTVKVKVEYNDQGALRGSVEAMGGTWLGQGNHSLYERGKVEGLGFRLPGWNYPLVLKSNGELAYDDYGGCWGNVKDLETLKSQYTISQATQAAAAQGWQTELNGTELVIHHPDGGSLTINGQSLDATGFTGTGCHDAIVALGLPFGDAVAKTEFGQIESEIKVGK